MHTLSGAEINTDNIAVVSIYIPYCMYSVYPLTLASVSIDTPKAAVREALGNQAAPITILSFIVYLSPFVTKITEIILIMSPATTIKTEYSTTESVMSLNKS